ncbi:MAG: LPS export ABC transporter periplasmic protein LptC [Neisseria sp.]|nr:LPS export ABC transporter periplasmic protein LptC [Neisseria sp.]
MNGRLKGWLFPLTLAAVLGGLSAWLGKISEIGVEETALNPKEPQYAMTGISGRRFDRQGALSERLDAESAWQLPKSNEVHLKHPQMQAYEQGRVLYRLNSERARYNTDSRMASFEQKVVLAKAAEAGRPAAVLTTEQLDVDTVGKTAASTRPVQFSYGESHGSSIGMTYDYEQGLLRLPERVKATIYDPKHP